MAVDPSSDVQLATLRAELKEWERAFAAKNGGRKASREDIKKDPHIAAKYKLYARLRAPEASSEKGAEDTTRKRKQRHDEEAEKMQHGHGSGFATPKKPPKCSSNHFSTPLKRNQTPSKNQQQHADHLEHPSQLDPYVPPSQFRTLFTPSRTKDSVSPLPLRTAIGPTPQRDGKALGLFDLLSASGRSTATTATDTPYGRKRRALEAETPSKNGGVMPIQGRGAGVGLPTTPSSQRSGAGAIRTRRYSLTPVSSAKKFYLSRFFASPTVPRFATIPEEDEEEEGGGGGGRGGGDEGAKDNTPRKEDNNDNTNSGTGLGLETPSFLRRRNFFSFRAAKKSDLSPIPIRKPPCVVGKKLSQLVQGLRDIEKEQMEDDLEALREMEAEEAQGKEMNGDDVLVKDSQLPIRPGPDGEEDGVESPSKSRSMWTKRTQKRTTKLVTMRPIRTRRKPPPKWETIVEGEEEENSGSEDELAAADDKVWVKDSIAESHLQSGNAGDEQHGSQVSNGERNESNDDGDSDGVRNESIVNVLADSRKRMQEAVKQKRLAEAKKHLDGDASDSEAKSATKTAGRQRKVNPYAHANYRTLKIRSRGSGSGAAGRSGGRFRRKR
ncbi:hypothetical protein VTO42DRAFT_4367 [Malbranchea cinnamomea]